MNHATAKRYGQYQVLAGSDGREEIHSLGIHDITYGAVDTRFDRRIHLRVLRPEFGADTAVKEAFLTAARSLARIRHSNIPGVLDAADGREGCYCAIEDPSGESLESVVGRLGCMDTCTALPILDQCAKVLRELWQSGQVITRLSPATIEVCYEGDEMIVKFTDLHLAPPSEGGGLARGKPSEAAADFRSPEEISAGTLDIRSNIYSLGLVFCELLGGRGGGRSFLEIVEKKRDPDLHPFSKLPEKVLYLMELMLHRDPARRIQTPYELRSLIEQCEREGGGGSLMIRQDDISAPTPGEERPAADILPLEFNLRTTLDSKGAFREAEDRIRGGKAVIRLFGPDESPFEVATCTSMAEKLLTHPHPNIVRVIRIQAGGRQRFIAYEHVGGNSLLEMMRKRRRLSLPEVLTLLSQAASAADHGAEHGVAGLAFTLSLVRIIPDQRPESGKIPAWMALPLHQWPSFTLKIPVCGSLPGVDEELPSSGSDHDRRAILASYLRALGETAHELLGGVKPRNLAFNEASYTPLSTLSEQGNIILRKALFGGGEASFASAAEFVDALKRTVSDKDLPASSAAFALPKDSGGGVKPAGPVAAQPIARKTTNPALGVGLLLGIALIVAALLFFQSGGRPAPSSRGQPAPQRNIESPPAPAVRETQPRDHPPEPPVPPDSQVPEAAPAPSPSPSSSPSADQASPQRVGIPSPSPQESVAPMVPEGNEGNDPPDKPADSPLETLPTEPPVAGSATP